MTELTFTVKNDEVLHYGQRIYRVGTQDLKTIREKCPVCKDTKTVILEGMTFKCPCCQGYTLNKSIVSICLRDYVAEEYIINSITIIGPERKSAYNRDGSPAGSAYPYASYSGFTKHGNEHSSVRRVEFSRSDFHDKEWRGRQPPDGRCFYDKASATAFVKSLHEKQKEKLKAFNEAHGTSHVYPFQY